MGAAAGCGCRALTADPRPGGRIPKLLGWAAFVLTAVPLGLVGYAVVSLTSNPGGSGADLGAKLLVAAAVIACAALAGTLTWLVARLTAKLFARGQCD